MAEALAPNTNDNEPFNPSTRSRPKINQVKHLFTLAPAELELLTGEETLRKMRYDAGFKEAGKCFANQKMKIPVAHRISSNLVRALETLNPRRIAQTGDDTEMRRLQARAVMIESFYLGFFSAIENEAVARDRVIQRVAEFAVMQACYDLFDPHGNSLENGVYHPSPEEDLEHGIDAWLKLGERSVALQVKCLHMEQTPDHFVVGVRNVSDIEDRIVHHKEFADASCFRDEKSRAKFVEGGKRMLTYCSPYGNVTSAYVIVPNLGQPGTLDFLYPTGLPKQTMLDQIDQLQFVAR